jgi:hypothetical protein
MLLGIYIYTYIYQNISLYALNRKRCTEIAIETERKRERVYAKLFVAVKTVLQVEMLVL